MTVSIITKKVPAMALSLVPEMKQMKQMNTPLLWVREVWAIHVLTDLRQALFLPELFHPPRNRGLG